MNEEESNRLLLNQTLDWLQGLNHAPLTECLALCLGRVQTYIGVASAARSYKADIEAALGNHEMQTEAENRWPETDRGGA